MWFVFVKEYFFFPLDPHLLQAGVAGQVQHGRSYQAPGAAVVGCVLAVSAPNTACRTDGLRAPSKSGMSRLCWMHGTPLVKLRGACRGISGQEIWCRRTSALAEGVHLSPVTVANVCSECAHGGTTCRGPSLKDNGNGEGFC